MHSSMRFDVGCTVKSVIEPVTMEILDNLNCYNFVKVRNLVEICLISV